MTRWTVAIALLAALAAAPARGQEAAADTAGADSVPADTAAADSVPADSVPPESAAAEPRTAPSLEGYRKIAILSRDMAPAVPGYETSVEIHRGPEGAQVLRFVTRGTAWALVVREAAGAEPYTLRDFDCSGAFSEQLQAGTPLAVPDCALPATPAAPAEDDEDD